MDQEPNPQEIVEVEPGELDALVAALAALVRYQLAAPQGADRAGHKAAGMSAQEAA